MQATSVELIKMTSRSTRFNGSLGESSHSANVSHFDSEKSNSPSSATLSRRSERFFSSRMASWRARVFWRREQILRQSSLSSRGSNGAQQFEQRSLTDDVQIPSIRMVASQNSVPSVPFLPSCCLSLVRSLADTSASTARFDVAIGGYSEIAPPRTRRMEREATAKGMIPGDESPRRRPRETPQC